MEVEKAALAWPMRRYAWTADRLPKTGSGVGDVARSKGKGKTRLTAATERGMSVPSMVLAFQA